MTDKTFDLVVEGTNTHPGTRFNGLVWNGDSPPDIVIWNRIMFVKVARYLAPGDQYRYIVASTAKLVGDKLEPQN